jgi:hypothetical protein
MASLPDRRLLSALVGKIDGLIQKSVHSNLFNNLHASLLGQCFRTS